MDIDLSIETHLADRSMDPQVNQRWQMRSLAGWKFWRKVSPVRRWKSQCCWSFIFGMCLVGCRCVESEITWVSEGVESCHEIFRESRLAKSNNSVFFALDQSSRLDAEIGFPIAQQNYWMESWDDMSFSLIEVSATQVQCDWHCA